MGKEGYINVTNVHIDVTRRTDFKSMLMAYTEKRKTLNVLNVIFPPAGEEVSTPNYRQDKTYPRMY